jgi:hypothetical protein
LIVNSTLASALVRASSITCALVTTTFAVRTDGPTTIVGETLNLQGGTNSELIRIDQETFTLKVRRYLFSGSGGTVVGIRLSSTSVLSVIDVDVALSTGDPSGDPTRSTFLLVEAGAVDIDVGKIDFTDHAAAVITRGIQVDGGKVTGVIHSIVSPTTSVNGAGLYADLVGSFIGAIDEVIFSDAASVGCAILVTGSSVVDVETQRLITTAGPTLSLSSSSDTRVTFQQIECGASANVIFCSTDSEKHISGQSITAQNVDQIITVLSDAKAYIDVQNITATQVDIGISVSSNGTLYLKYDRFLVSGNVTAAAMAFADNYTVDITGSLSDFSASTTPLPVVQPQNTGRSMLRLGRVLNNNAGSGGTGFLVQGSASCSAYIDELLTDAEGLIDQSLGTVWFEAKFAQTASLAQLVLLNVPAVSPNYVNIGGVLRAPLSSAVVRYAAGSTVKLTRILSSTMVTLGVGLGNCVVTDTNPVVATIEPFSATTVQGADVSFVPPGAFFFHNSVD